MWDAFKTTDQRRVAEVKRWIIKEATEENAEAEEGEEVIEVEGGPLSRGLCAIIDLPKSWPNCTGYRSRNGECGQLHDSVQYLFPSHTDCTALVFDKHHRRLGGGPIVRLIHVPL